MFHLCAPRGSFRPRRTELTDVFSVLNFTARSTSIDGDFSSGNKLQLIGLYKNVSQMCQPSISSLLYVVRIPKVYVSMPILLRLRKQLGSEVCLFRYGGSRGFLIDADARAFSSSVSNLVL